MELTLYFIFNKRLKIYIFFLPDVNMLNYRWFWKIFYVEMRCNLVFWVHLNFFTSNKNTKRVLFEFLVLLYYNHYLWHYVMKEATFFWKCWCSVRYSVSYTNCSKIMAVKGQFDPCQTKIFITITDDLIQI